MQLVPAARITQLLRLMNLSAGREVVARRYQHLRPRSSQTASSTAAVSSSSKDELLFRPVVETDLQKLTMCVWVPAAPTDKASAEWGSLAHAVTDHILH